MEYDTRTLDWLADETHGLEQFARESNLYSFRERLFVMQAVAHADSERMRRHDRPLTEPEREVVERLAWALFDATYSEGLRVPDDLDGIESALVDADMA
jgi:hypothetical protein